MTLADDGARGARVAIRTLGCKVNRSDSEALAHSLLRHGAALVVEDEADIVVVNTCTVTAEADRKVRKAVRRAAESKRRPTVIVTGCMAVTDADGASALGRSIIVEPDRSRVADIVDVLAAGRAGAVEPGPATGVFTTRVMLKVQDGCAGRCAYCIVPRARGNPRSTPLVEIASRALELARGGCREVVVTGVNVGRYKDGDAGIADVLRTVEEAGIARVRLSSIEPGDLAEPLLARLAEIASLCPHLHVPLQSASDAVLGAMRRGYTFSEYTRAIASARSAIPGLTVTTDVIVGFPGETEDDAIITEEAISAIGFSRTHVFRYSRRSGTEAASMPEQVPAAVIADRAARARKIGDAAAAEYARSRRGQEANLLVERRKGSIAEGTTEDYLKVRVRDSRAAVGELRRVRIGESEKGAIWGETIGMVVK